MAWTCSPSQWRRAATSSGFCLAAAGEEPLLELVEDQEGLLAGSEECPAPQRGQALGQIAIFGQVGADFAQAAAQAGLGLKGGGLDVDRQHAWGEPGQEARFHQRRLAAARRAMDQTYWERVVGVDGFDARLPEPDTGGQAVAVARAGHELEEEVGVVLVERSQTLGHDPDRGFFRIGGLNWRGRRGRSRRRGRGGRRADRSRCGGRGGDARGLGREEVPQVLGHVAGGRVPLGRPLRHRLQADSLELPWDRVIDLTERARIDGGDLIQHLRRRIAPKWPAAGQEAHRARPPG